MVQTSLRNDFDETVQVYSLLAAIFIFFFFFFFFFFCSVTMFPIPLSIRSARFCRFQNFGSVGFLHCLVYSSCVYFLSLSPPLTFEHGMTEIISSSERVKILLCCFSLFLEATLTQDIADHLLFLTSRCQLQVASNVDYRRAQSALRSTDDFNFAGLMLVCHILPILLCVFFQRRST